MGHPACRQLASIPACFPLQLLQRGVIVMPWRSTCSYTAGLSGGCGPQASAVSGSPIFLSIPSATSRCAGSLECEAQASASSLGPNPNLPAAPSATSTYPWNGLAAERQKATSSGSPAWATRAPP